MLRHRPDVEVPTVIPFICTSCGQMDIDSPECASCVQSPAVGVRDAAVA